MKNPFILYNLEKKPDFYDQLCQKIEQDIIDNKVQCIIIDYKLDSL